MVIGGLPRVSRSINWVRVAQRFPVKIMVENPMRRYFALGLRRSPPLSRNNERLTTCRYRSLNCWLFFMRSSVNSARRLTQIAHYGLVVCWSC